jgi:hypothetical protein
MSWFGTATDFGEFEDAWARDSGLKSLKGIDVARISITREERIVVFLIDG